MFDEYISSKLVGRDPIMRLDVESSLSWHSTTFVWVRDQDIMALGVYKSLVDITLWDILCKVEEVT